MTGNVYACLSAVGGTASAANRGKRGGVLPCRLRRFLRLLPCAAFFIARRVLVCRIGEAIVTSTVKVFHL